MALVHIIMVGMWPSGQRRQTVNLFTIVYGGSNPSVPTKYRILLPLSSMVEL